MNVCLPRESESCESATRSHAATPRGLSLDPRFHEGDDAPYDLARYGALIQRARELSMWRAAEALHDLWRDEAAMAARVAAIAGGTSERKVA